MLALVLLCPQQGTASQPATRAGGLVKCIDTAAALRNWNSRVSGITNSILGCALRGCHPVPWMIVYNASCALVHCSQQFRYRIIHRVDNVDSLSGGGGKARGSSSSYLRSTSIGLLLYSSVTTSHWIWRGRSWYICTAMWINRAIPDRVSILPIMQIHRLAISLSLSVVKSISLPAFFILIFTVADEVVEAAEEVIQVADEQQLFKYYLLSYKWHSSLAQISSFVYICRRCQ